MLLVVKYITNDTISDWGAPLKNSERGFTRPSTSYISYYLGNGIELDSIYFKKCNHAMEMGSF